MMRVVPDSRCQHDLRIAGDARGEVGRQRERLVERVGVQRLRAALPSPPSPRWQVRTTLLNTSCGGERPARGLACVRAARASGVDFGSNGFISFAHSMRAARCFATSMKKFMPAFQKNDSRGAKRSMSSPAVEPGAHIFDAVGERIGELEIAGRARLLHVIAGDRDRVELRHMRRGEGEDVGDDAQRRRRADRCRCCAP